MDSTFAGRRVLRAVAIFFVGTIGAAWAASAAPEAPLAAAEAAVVGGWTANRASDVNGVYLAPLSRTEGCLKLAGGTLVFVGDHLRPEKPVFWKLHRLTPGLYGLAGVGWGAREAAGYPTSTSWAGISRQRGQMWTIQIAPGAVTNIGVWSVSSPYPQRYVIGATALERDKALAARLAEGAGPLVTAQPVMAEVVEAKAACPPVQSAP